MDKNLVKSSCLVQGVAGDGQKDVEKSVVTTESQQHEVKAVNTSTVLSPSFRVYRSVHHLQGQSSVNVLTTHLDHHYLIPVFARQNLKAKCLVILMCLVFDDRGSQLFLGRQDP